MTWILGVATQSWAPDRAFLVSDTRATWANGRYVDCLQKIRAIGPRTIAGFAGSVQLGFEALDHLQSELKLAEPQGSPLRAIAMFRIPRLLRRFFRNASSANRRLGLEVIVADASGSHPTTLVCAYRSPTFSFETISPGDTAISIGSGTRHFLDAFRRFPEPVLEANTRLEGGPMVDVDFLGNWVNRIATEHPEPSVGTGFHAAAATTTTIVGPRFSQMELHPVSKPVEIAMPAFDQVAPPTHTHFVTSDDGTFSYFVSGPAGLVNALSLLKGPDGSLVAARGMTTTETAHVTSYGSLRTYARSKGLTAVSRAVASVR